MKTRKKKSYPQSVKDQICRDYPIWTIRQLSVRNHLHIKTIRRILIEGKWVIRRNRDRRLKLDAFSFLLAETSPDELRIWLARREQVSKMVKKFPEHLRWEKYIGSVVE